MAEVEWSADVGQVGWIRQRLGQFDSGEATSVVPAGFAAYARVLHPAHDLEERPVRWAEVAARNGLELRPDTQFPDIALLPPTGDGTQTRDVVGPDEGTLAATDATTLIEILRRHTTSPHHCWFCLWDGYGWEPAARVSLSSLRRDDEPPQWAEPGLYDGPDPIEQALAFVRSERQTPNLWWAHDRAWCVATEIDLEWTYIGGPAALIEDVLGDDRLEALPADPGQHHHLRTPVWLTAAIDDAVTRLLAGHAARVETAQGTVTARLRRPGRLRHGDLWTTSARADRSSDASSWTSLSDRGDEALGRQVHHQLAWAVLDLLR